MFTLKESFEQNFQNIPLKFLKISVFSCVFLVVRFKGITKLKHFCLLDHRCKSSIRTLCLNGIMPYIWVSAKIYSTERLEIRWKFRNLYCSYPFLQIVRESNDLQKIGETSNFGQIWLFGCISDVFGPISGR